MKRSELRNLIRKEIVESMSGIDDVQDVNLSPVVVKRINQFVDTIKDKTLTKTKVAAILNAVIEGLGLNRTQVTMYMNMLKQNRPVRVDKSSSK
jgi:hypothetical protein